MVRSAARGIDSRRELKVLKEHCVALQSSADAASLAIEELLVDSFGKEWADHEMRMYEEAGGESQMEHQQQEHFMQMLIESPETNERTQQLALLWRVIVPEMSRLLVRIHADSGRWYTQVGQTSSAVRSPLA